MHEDPLLRHFGSSCQVPYQDEQKTIDYRGLDQMPFDCAMHNFCPDPCCGSYEADVVVDAEGNRQEPETPKGFAKTKKICTEAKDYPCGITEQACSLNFKKNKIWNDLIRNRLNTTCSCAKVAKNYVWDDRLRMCVDQDECRAGNFECEPNSICRNLESDYYCTCRLGYKFDFEVRKCIRDTNFEMDDAIRAQAGILPGMTPPPKLEQKGFELATYFRWLIDYPSSANRYRIQFLVVVCISALSTAAVA